MPTKDRKYYIRKHNEMTEKENHKNGSMQLDGSMINNAADMALHRQAK